jgi:type VI secretion system protein ImpK
MQKDNSKLFLEETFGNFCLQIFGAKKNIKNNSTGYDYKTLHKNVSAYLKTSLESEKSLSFAGSAREVIYVMAAIADEVFLNTEWSGKQYWEENMLEQRHFGSQIAGEKFFTFVDKLVLEHEPLSTEKAEICLRALSLGFKGKYRGADDEKIGIDCYRNKLFEFIQKNDKAIFLIGHRLFQKEYTRTLPTVSRKLLPDASVINYLCAFFVFMFFVISSVVWILETKDITRLLADISQIALRE